MARFGGAVMRGISPRRSWQPLLRRAYGNYEEFDVFAGADTAEKVRINGYDENKFYANGVEVEGSIICLSRLTLKWTPKSFEEVIPESLALFELLRPAPEILILGCGKRMGRVSQEVRDYLRSNGIKLEAIDTANATSTFNILNEEGRIVAAAMLPQGPRLIENLALGKASFVVKFCGFLSDAHSKKCLYSSSSDAKALS